MAYLSLGFLIIQFLFGLILINFFDKKDRLFLFEKILAAIIIGEISGFFVTLVFALLFKNLWIGIVISSFLELILIFWKNKSVRNIFSAVYFTIKNRNFDRQKSRKFIVGFGLAFLIIILWLTIALGVLIYDQNDSQIKGILIGWGDSAYHLSMIERLSVANPFEVAQPIFANSPLTYPFLINFASAILLKFQNGILFAFDAPLVILGLSGITLFFFIALRFLKSSWWAFAILLIIIFGSGLGFWQFFQDIKTISATSSYPITETILNPPHNYTHLDNRTGGKPSSFDSTQNIVWIVPAISFLSHQRSFVWGFAMLAVLILLLWLYKDDLSIWRIGFLAGLMPLVHGHTFLSLAIAGLAWFFWAAFKNKNWKGWILFGTISALVAIPSLLFLNQGMHFWGQGTGETFFKLQFGWMTCAHVPGSWFECLPKPGTDSNAFIFWSKNFGVNFWLWSIFLILTIFGGKKFLRHLNENFYDFLEWILAPSFLIFALSNFFIFQPWEFDNNKVFFNWWILASFISVGLLYYLVIILTKVRLKYLAIAFAAAAIFFGTFAGILDVQARIFNFKKNHFGYYNAAQFKLAEWIKNNTAPNSVFLVGTSPTAPPAVLAGRQLYLGYTGWLWTQGINYQPREKNIAEILQNKNLKLACSENINYILLDDDLINSYKFIDLNFFKNLDIVYKDESNNIFLIKVLCD
jgi:hypothetical protein